MYKFVKGQKVRHPSWVEGQFAIVVESFLMVVRERRGKNGRLLKAKREDCEPVVRLDRYMPIEGSSETDNRWMESGLIEV